MSSPAVKELQGILPDLIALSLQAKQAHWNVTGPSFRPLHQQFDELADAARGWYDDVAERALALGTPADGRLATVAKNATIEDLPAGAIAGPEAVALLLDRLERVAKNLRGRLDRLGEHDLVSQDLAIGIIEGLEKQAWMLRVQKS